MRVPESVKNLLQFARQKNASSKLPTSPPGPEDPQEDDVHYTPAGQWPTSGPKPSKFGVLFYYISLVCCIIGILSLFKCTYLPHESKPEALIIGSSLVSLGLLCLCVTNFIYNREQRLLVEYLQGKIHELMMENQGKGPRALDS